MDKFVLMSLSSVLLDSFEFPKSSFRVTGNGASVDMCCRVYDIGLPVRTPFVLVLGRTERFSGIALDFALRSLELYNFAFLCRITSYRIRLLTCLIVCFMWYLSLLNLFNHVAPPQRRRINIQNL